MTHMRSYERSSAANSGRACSGGWSKGTDEILQASERQRISWPAFCAEAAKRGLTDTRGRPPSEGNARETWRQARIPVANARKAEAAKPPPRVGAVYPSRIPKDWRPTIVPPMAPSSGPARSGLLAVVAKPGVPARAQTVAPHSPKRKPRVSKLHSIRCESSFETRTGTSIFATVSKTSIPFKAPVHRGSQREPLSQRGPFWIPIIPPRGSFFHAESQPVGSCAV